MRKSVRLLTAPRSYPVSAVQPGHDAHKKGNKVMNTHRNLTKMIAGALLSGGVAIAGFGLATGTANAFNPQPDPPGVHIHPAFNPQPEPPGKQAPHSKLRHAQ